MVAGADGGAPVEVLDLRKDFGPVTAVAGVSLRIEANEFVALLGPSGSGKTTILSLIAGFERPTAGEVLIDGRPVTGLPANRRNLGMVFQRYALFPHMTVAENIGFPLRMRGVARPEVRRRVEEMLVTVKLEGYGARRPSQLSGGQQQRVAFARAVVHRPPALLMDEPLAALDKKLREQMQLEIKHLQRQLGVTVVFVTHDQTEALTMADRVAVLNEGRLEQVGTPEALYEQPATRFVADFIGETNLLEGRLLAAADGRAAIEVAGGLRFEGALAGGKPVPARGGPACLAIRPEKIGLREPEDAAAGGASTVLRGHLVEAVYGGATVGYAVKLDPAGLDVFVRGPAPGGSGRRWQAGEAVALTWSSADARIYPGGR